MDLLTAFRNTYAHMKPQVQGTCGIYSFWYATILLNHMDPASHPTVPFPRACHNAGSQLGSSMRKFAKDTIKSGQGELLSGHEMRLLVRNFGYARESYWGKTTREAYVTEHLTAGHPILFAYLCGNGPVTAATAVGTAQDHYGPHWSLLIAETPDHYGYINPHAYRDQFNAVWPIPQFLWYPKKTVLDSNAAVDDVKYDQYWRKVGKGNLTRVGAVQTPMPTVPAGTKTKEYNLGDSVGRQRLNNVLIAVL